MRPPHAPSWPAAPNCFNTISGEYPQLGGNYEVIHHTQLLARLVSDGELTPVNAIQEKLTYHDPRGHRRGATPGPFGRAKERRQRQ
jgi:hypothetical protein